MPLIATRIEPQRVTRIFLDCRDAPPDPADRLRIERAIEDSAALAESTEEALSQHETLGGSTVRSSPLEDASRYNEAPAWLRRAFKLTGGEDAKPRSPTTGVVVCSQTGTNPPPTAAQTHREE
jgi:hypothetical protein